MIRPKHNELEQTITAGPPERAEDISLTTYRVFIEGPDPLRDPWPENVPLTFRARTEPPGYEAEVTWMAATKYGSCDPAMGEGPELTVVFQDTFGDQNRQWLGVKADQAVLAQDQKCVGEDCDEDGVPNDADNCVVRANPLQVDIDNDGVGDLCDNCPTVMNPDQADANRDGGGDACVPPLEITLFGDPFIPDPGIAPELLEPELPHPLMEGVVHPVLQLESALMEGHRERLEEAGVELLEPIAHNVFLVAVRQDRLSDALSLPFVRSLFPLTPEYRRGPEPEDGGVMADCFPFQAP